MTRTTTLSAALLPALLSALASCSSSSSAAETPGDPDPQTGGPGGGGATLTTETLEGLVLDDDCIVDLDATVDPLFTDVFARYSAVEREGQTGRVHILAEAGVSDAALTRARRVLAWTLTDRASTTAGADKSDVFDAMVANGAVLTLFETKISASTSRPEVEAVLSGLGRSVVPLTEEHIIREGSDVYMQAFPEIDRTFGAASALVLRTGLETARPALVTALETHAENALVAGRLTAPATLPDTELASHALALAADVHAGIFEHNPDGDGIARGPEVSLACLSRDELATADPNLTAWVEDFLGTHHDFVVELPESFTGNFDCLRRSYNPYSARSQYLREIHLTGTNTAEIFGAPEDVILVGNDGNNNLKGRRGYDRIVGGLGFDTAVFSGPRADYDVRFEDGYWVVEDVFGGHEQTDILDGIERIQFTDGGENL